MSDQTAQATDAGPVAARSPSAAAKTEPHTLVVDPMQRGDALTISEAIAKAKPSDRILVRPGLYNERLVIDKPLEILGVGAPGDVVVQVEDARVILFGIAAPPRRASSRAERSDPCPALHAGAGLLHRFAPSQ